MQIEIDIEDWPAGEWDQTQVRQKNRKSNGQGSDIACDRHFGHSRGTDGPHQQESSQKLQQKGRSGRNATVDRVDTQQEWRFAILLLLEISNA